MRRGAYDFVVKPAAEERLVTTSRNAMEREVLQKAVSEIRSNYAGKGSTHGFIGTSLPMIAVYKTIDAVSQSSASVFITGESGTGKEVCAAGIHAASPRRKAEFVALNCAALPKDLIESEIFGHVKGAFTVPDRGSEKPTPFRRPGSAAVAARLGAWRVTNEAATRFGTVSTISYGRRNTGTRCSAEMSACVVGN